MNKLTFPVLIEKDEDGYFATCPSLPGCYTQGDTYEEVLVNIQDAISLHLQDRQAAEAPLPRRQSFSLATVAVTVWVHVFHEWLPHQSFELR